MPTVLKTNPFARETFVYIRHLDAAEVDGLLPPDALADISDAGDLFLVLSADGERLAIVEGRDAAFEAARANDLKPLSLH